VGQFAIKSAYLLGAKRVMAIDRFPERLQPCFRHPPSLQLGGHVARLRAVQKETGPVHQSGTQAIGIPNVWDFCSAAGPDLIRDDYKPAGHVAVAGMPQAMEGLIMPRGDKTAYTERQKRQARHIEEGYIKRGVPEEEAEKRAWATVNAMTGGGKKGGSGRGKAMSKAPAKKGGKKGGSASGRRRSGARSASPKGAAGKS
jgi:plasmid stabilization system protein ParE